MTHGSLFSGIGGAELAAEWVGWDNVFHCEMNPFARKVLDYYWPNATSYEDIKTTDFTFWRGRIDILTGGFPCQPYSAAGKRKGTEDDRHLWPEMLRAIREIEPRWIVGENVFGLVNWNDGLVFEQVQADLENEGYEVQPYILPAVSVDAPHRRDRIWFVAYSQRNDDLRTQRRVNGEEKSMEGVDGTENSSTRESSRTDIRHNEGGKNVEHVAANSSSARQSFAAEHGFNEESKFIGINGYGKLWTSTNSESESSRRKLFEQQGKRKFGGQDSRAVWLAPHPNSYERCEGRLHEDKSKEAKRHSGTFDTRNHWGTWQDFPTQSPVRQRDDGISSRMVGFVTINLYERIINTNKENRIEDLPKVWKEIQSKEIWEKIRRLYSLESKEILFQTMQLYTTGYKPQIQLSPFSEKFCEPVLQYLWKHGEFRRSPQGQELEKQRFGQSTDPLPFLPHEVALAARRFESAVTKFDSWHAKESIKGYGNAWVPQVAFQIFKAIEEYESTYSSNR
ncbi:DNA (cytosine-5-)-methyltransferase [Olivibacter sp. 47]|uniref:DNA cytosine methyltransferase n=1 Tax=Olivibacter sp. 47 TaxID=3056486 RepID=UPI0025A3F28A|nr:DNA (cytosine-5-)-methyltransferase [Olivibacter sp. 47]MDM8174765.1 DNA (cytosine-5-)-methyltransferase [Olivibacter sp. 47]